jgi:DNA-binding transcriptional regulator GbsR (MarR family)
MRLKASQIGTSRLGELFGSVTKGNVLEAPALSDRPLTAYGLAKAYNMKIAKTYATVNRLLELGLVAPSKGRGDRIPTSSTTMSARSS